MSAPLTHRLIQCLALSAGMACMAGAWAAEHGEHGGKASTASAKEAASDGEPSIRPALPRATVSPSTKGGSTQAAEGKNSVSMAELRDLIDQKIAEVRAKQAAATPVVKVQSRAPAKPKRDPALQPAVFAPQGQEELIPVPEGAPRVSSTGGAAHAAAAPVARAVRPSHQASSPLVDPRGHDVHWAYSGDTGPESWGMLKPEFQQCMLGKRQSPIDIRDGLPVNLDPIQFDYHPSGFKVIDNGHTIQANVEPGNSITLQGKRYELVQFHFHRPSEERINGKQYDMVAHMVHKDAEGKLAVIAVLIEQGNQHPMMQLVWNALPLEKGTEQASSVPIDLNQILPDQKQYFTYMGSLTTPPCSEGVLWMVMKHPAQMSREQIGIFAKMYPMNARPIQSAQGRMIKDGQ